MALFYESLKKLSFFKKLLSHCHPQYYFTAKAIWFPFIAPTSKLKAHFFLFICQGWKGHWILSRLHDKTQRTNNEKWYSIIGYASFCVSGPWPNIKQLINKHLNVIISKKTIPKTNHFLLKSPSVFWRNKSFKFPFFVKCGCLRL